MRARSRGPVDIAVLEWLEEAALDRDLVAGRVPQLRGGGADLAVLLRDRAVNDEVLAVRVAGEEAALKLLHVAPTHLVCLGHRVLQVAALVAVLAPRSEHVARDGVSAGLRGPVHRTVLEVHKAAHTVRCRGLARDREAQPARRAAERVVLGQDRAEQHVRASVWGPVGGAAAEVLGLALGVLTRVVLVVDAGADRAGLGGLGDRADRGALGAAVRLRHLQRVGDVRPCLRHLELPVLPRVHTRRAEAHNRLYRGARGVVHERLGGQAGEHLQADAGRVGLALCYGLRVAEVVAAGACGDVDRHVLQVLNAQLRVVVDPVLRAQRTPHRFRVVAAGVHLRRLDRGGHAGGGGVQVAGEGADELEQVRVALSQVDRGGAAHGQAHHGAGAIGAELVVQHRDELLGQERLPLVVLAVVLPLPVGVEGGLAADREDDVDVLVGVELLDVGFDGPAVFVVTRAQAVERPHLGELRGRVGVPVARQQDLHLDRVVRHGRGVDKHGDAAVGDPLDAVHLHALGQARDLRAGLHLDRGALRRVVRAQAVGDAAVRRHLRGQVTRQARLRVGGADSGGRQREGKGGGQHRGGEPRLGGSVVSHESPTSSGYWCHKSIDQKLKFHLKV